MNIAMGVLCDVRTVAADPRNEPAVKPVVSVPEPSA
jgi:hypothetical protein